MEFWLWLLKVGLVGLATVGAIVWAFSRGKDSQENAQLNAEKKANEKAKRAQDRVITDAAYRDRVRDKYRGP
jgi:hypothetical protein